jgi:hypothetical protein
MPNKRMINGYVWEDEFFYVLSIFNRLLWIGVLTACADDQGRFMDNAALIRSKVFPMDDIPLSQIEDGIKVFASEGKIIRYTEKKKKCAQIVNWWKHQTPRWAGESTLPAPKGWTDRWRYHGTGGTQGGTIKTMNWDKAGGFAENYILSNIVSNTKPKDDVNDDVNDDDDGEGEFSPALRELITAYQDSTGILAAPDEDAFTAYRDMEMLNIKPADIVEGVKWLRDNGKRYEKPEFVINSAKKAKRDREQLERRDKRDIPPPMFDPDTDETVAEQYERERAEGKIT